MSRHARIYLPLSPDQCRQLSTARSVPGPLEGYAVTQAVRTSDPQGDEESWEFAALQDAALSCAVRSAPVLVAAADLDIADLDDSAPAGSRVRVTGALPLQRVAAFHVGDDVLTRQPPAPADPGSEIELSWYDTTELDHLVSLV